MLLGGAGFSFDICSPEVEEVEDGMYACHIPLVNAVRKAAAVSGMFPGSLVIGADTAIECDGLLIGKPCGLEDARRTLMMLSGRRHRVITGVALLARQWNLETTFSEESFVYFKPFGDAVVNDYLARVEVLDKAGSYNIAESGELLISRIEGPRDNIIGLPCEKLSRAIQAAASLMG
jgi:septum formation protein